MKNISKLICALCLCISVAHGQSFKKAFEVKLPEPLTHVQMEWIAIDGDTLLDIVVTGVASDGVLKIMTFKNNLTSFQFSNEQDTGFKDGYLQLADWNDDNQIDLLIAGKTTINTNALFVFNNKGNFSFQKADKLVDSGSQFRVNDLNGDGRLDILTFGFKNGPPLSLYENTPTGLRLAYDSANLDIKDIVIADFNNDGTKDFVISGQDNALAPFTTLFMARNNFSFLVSPVPAPVSGSLSAIDENADGKIDLIGTGIVSGIGQRIWYNDGKTFTLHDQYSAPGNSLLFTGDMNSDGTPDALINGVNELGKKVNYVRDAASTISIDTTGLLTQRAGDFDHDGDLDVAQIKDSLHQQWIKIIRADVPTINKRPPTPAATFAISAFNKTFISWNSQPDDHTAISSLTYDVWLGSSTSSVISPAFNRGNSTRMTVTHGNSGTGLSTVIKGLTDGHYEYLIQSVDNAYNGSLFAGGGVVPCFDLSHENVNACKDHEVILTSASDANWFSSASGSLGYGVDLKFVAHDNDTLFSFVPQGKDCSQNKVWIIHVFDIPQQSQRQTVYVCKDKKFKLGITPGWKNIEWDTTPVTTGVDSISLVLTNDRVVTVKATSASGCPYTKEFTIHISEPQLNLNGDTFRSVKGNPVQLEASGKFNHFRWDPPAGLSDPLISNPVAEPAQTTSYTVTATDSIGCIATGKIQVQIEFTAFVPNLFTPNGDSKNDVLLIYGLGAVSNFQFQIFNREGSKVYETSDPSQASASGWNGFVNGTRQPSGIYYWKVEGNEIGGERLLLNGKKTGSILLVH